MTSIRPLAVRTVPGGMERAIAAAADHLIGSFAAERARWPLWMPALFGVGIGIYFALAAEPARWVGPAALAASLAFAAGGRRRQGLLMAGWVASLVAAGFAVAQLRTEWIAAPVLAKRIGPVAVQGRVVLGERRETGQRLTLDRLAIGRLAPARTPETVRITLRQSEPVFRPGDIVRLRAVLHPPAGPAEPGAFDFARRAWFDRLGGVGYAIGKAARLSTAADGGVALALERLRQRITDRIRDVLPGSTGGMAAALMTGDRGGISEDVQAAMRDSGLAHLISISGLHMGLVAALLFFVIRFGMAALERPVLRYPVKKWAAAVTMAGAFGYLMISGNTVPTQRSFVMLALMLLAVLIDRQPISMNLVSWAAGAVLLFAPESLLSVSFQMSFGAVIALIAVYEAGAARLAKGGREGRWPRPVAYLAGVVITTFVAGFASAPFGLYHFNRIALYGVLANAIAVPLSAFWVMPAAVLAFLLMPFGLEAPALHAMGYGIDVIIAVAKEIQALPGAVAMVPSMPPVGLVLITAGGLWLCLWRKAWRFWGVLPVAGGLATVLLASPPDVIVNETGKLFAVRAPDGKLAVSSNRSGLTQETWLRREGLLKGETLPRFRMPGPAWWRCDSLGCIYRKEGYMVALVRNSAALADDCRRADIVIASVSVRRRSCRGPALIIDHYDLWRGGPHVLWLEADGIRVENVRAARGDRPWTGASDRLRQ